MVKRDYSHMTEEDWNHWTNVYLFNKEEKANLGMFTLPPHPPLPSPHPPLTLLSLSPRLLLTLLSPSPLLALSSPSPLITLLSHHPPVLPLPTPLSPLPSPPFPSHPSCKSSD